MSIPKVELSLDMHDSSPLDHQTRACLRMWASCFYNGLVEAADSYVMSRKADRKHSRDFSHELFETEALRWFYDDKDLSAGSFIWLCELFNLDPERARSTARAQFRTLSRRQRRANKELKAAVVE